MNKKILIIDYKLGNIMSVKRAVEYHGAEAEVSDDFKKILNADRIIIPGVGNFANGIININYFREYILNFVEKERPLMGICLGMQLMYQKSEEDQYKNNGLSYVKGSVIKFKNNFENLVVPHVGWNTIDFADNRYKNKIFNKITKDSRFYFVHSYYCDDKDQESENYYSIYSNIKFCAATIKKNVYLFQFHPEKSSNDGLQIYKNFLTI
jgi:glutamine amidotransferase